MEDGFYAEAYKDGKLLSTFNRWYLTPTPVSGSRGFHVEIKLTAREVILANTLHIPCDLILYKTKKTIFSKPWRKFFGHIRHDKNAVIEYDHYFEPVREMDV
jgi:hypothetical protein